MAIPSPHRQSKPKHQPKSKKPKARRDKGEGGLYQRSDGYWEASLDLGLDENGRRIRKRITGRSQEAVSEKLLELRFQKKKNALASGGASGTVGEYAESWLKDYVQINVRESTYESYETIMRKHILPHLGRIPLEQVRADDIQRLMRLKLESGLSRRRVQYIHAVIRMMFRQAVGSRILSVSPVDSTKPPTVVQREGTVFGPEEARTFISAIEEDRMAALYFLALTTGLRRGELAGLKWDDVDLDRGTIRVRRSLVPVHGKILVSEPKSERSKRCVALSSTTVTVLKQHKEKQEKEMQVLGDQYQDYGWLFCWPDGTRLRPEWITHRFHELLKDAGLPQIRLHDLRHTHATLLLLAGVPTEVISERLGHASKAFTAQVYEHPLPVQHQEAAEKIDKFLH